MGLETANLIHELVETNPTSADKRRQGDDHIRLVKSVMKANLPNILGIINASHEEINFLLGVTRSIQEQLDEKLTSSSIDLSPYAERDISNNWTRTQAIETVDLGQEAGSFIVNGSAGDTFKVELIGDSTMSFSGLLEGQSITIKVIQGGSGSHTLSYGGSVHVSFGVAPTLSTSPGSYDIFGGKVIDGIVVLGFLGDLSSAGSAS